MATCVELQWWASTVCLISHETAQTPPEHGRQREIAVDTATKPVRTPHPIERQGRAPANRAEPPAQSLWQVEFGRIFEGALARKRTVGMVRHRPELIPSPKGSYYEPVSRGGNDLHHLSDNGVSILAKMVEVGRRASIARGPCHHRPQRLHGRRVGRDTAYVGLWLLGARMGGARRDKGGAAVLAAEVTVIRSARMIKSKLGSTSLASIPLPSRRLLRPRQTCFQDSLATTQAALPN